MPCLNLVVLSLLVVFYLVSSPFVNSRVEFVRRQANGVAHSLAKEATLLASPATYYDIPYCIESLIINEML